MVRLKNQCLRIFYISELVVLFFIFVFISWLQVEYHQNLFSYIVRIAGMNQFLWTHSVREINE